MDYESLRIEKGLNQDAVEWLRNINYFERGHEERRILIKAARIIYPNETIV